MKVIIAGSRTITDPALIEFAVKRSGFHVTEVVSGCCNGADALGERWATSERIPVRRFRPDWDKHGKAAGPIRNNRMAEYADALIAIWDGESRGTKHMIDTACKHQMPVFIYKLPPTQKAA